MTTHCVTRRERGAADPSTHGLFSDVLRQRDAERDVLLTAACQRRGRVWQPYSHRRGRDACQRRRLR